MATAERSTCRSEAVLTGGGPAHDRRASHLRHL